MGILKKKVDLELSVGDYILSGGEIPIMLIIDSICRLLPEVLKNKFSIDIESFNDGLLDYPQFTKPAKYLNLEVPSILLSGNHGGISLWRYKKRLEQTFSKRPDLLLNKKLSEKEKNFIRD